MVKHPNFCIIKTRQDQLYKVRKKEEQKIQNATQNRVVSQRSAVRRSEALPKAVKHRDAIKKRKDTIRSTMVGYNCGQEHRGIVAVLEIFTTLLENFAYLI